MNEELDENTSQLRTNRRGGAPTALVDADLGIPLLVPGVGSRLALAVILTSPRA